METFYKTERIEINITITEDKIFCEYGALEYSFAEDSVIINAISVYLKRNYVGTRLVNELEILARQKGFATIEVPASPTKEAIQFWKSLGYRPAFEEDLYWAKKIVRSYRENAWDTTQGVVTMVKKGTN
jgi:N-acetylglutamate synthase-like GNAT family acetyltransferase